MVNGSFTKNEFESFSDEEIDALLKELEEENLLHDCLNERSP